VSREVESPPTRARPRLVGVASVLFAAAALGLIPACKGKKKRSDDASPASTTEASSSPGALAPGGLSLGGLGRPSAPALPFPLEKLPPRTAFVARTLVRDVSAYDAYVRPADLPARGLHAFYASMYCGFGNLVVSLANAHMPVHHEAIAHALRNLDETRDALRCGRTLAEKVPSGGASYLVLFPALGPMGMGRVDGMHLPGVTSSLSPPAARYSPRPATPGLDDVRCIVMPRIGQCTEPFAGTARLSGTEFWLVGTAAELAVFGARHAEATTLDDEGKRLAALAKSLDDKATTVQLGRPESFESSIRGGWFGVMPGFSPEPLSLARAVVDERCMWGTTRAHLDGGELVMVLEAGNEEGAKRVRSSLDAWRAWLVSEVTKGLPAPALPPGVPPSAGARKVIEDVARRAEQEAAATAKVEVSGTRVTLRATIAPVPEQQRLLDAAYDERRATMAVVERALGELAEGRRPSDADLFTLGGSALVEALKSAQPSTSSVP
jgi:hypothetical protein